MFSISDTFTKCCMPKIELRSEVSHRHFEFHTIISDTFLTYTYSRRHDPMAVTDKILFKFEFGNWLPHIGITTRQFSWSFDPCGKHHLVFLPILVPTRVWAYISHHSRCHRVPSQLCEHLLALPCTWTSSSERDQPVWHRTENLSLPTCCPKRLARQQRSAFNTASSSRTTFNDV